MHVSTWPPKAAISTAVAPLKNGGTLPGSRPDHDFLPNGTGWFDRWRLAANADNDYQIDREAQARNEIFSGITDIHLQDQAVTESMGDIVDHTFEHLAPSDQMITRTRRHLLRQARAFRDTGQTPPGVDDPEILLQARAGFFVADPATDWEQAYAEQVEKAERPASDMKAAE